MRTEPLLTIEQVAELCNVSPQTIAREVKAGFFPEPLRISRRLIRWQRKTIVDFLKAKTREAEQANREKQEA